MIDLAIGIFHGLRSIAEILGWIAMTSFLGLVLIAFLHPNKLAEVEPDE